MEQDLNNCREKLLKLSAYAASENFPNSSWFSQRTGQILIKTKSKQNAILAVVGRVLENRLDCSACGNFGKRDREQLAKAKYQFLLGKPEKTVFAADFETALHNFCQIQDTIAIWLEQEHFLVRDNQQTVLRFTRSIFKQRRAAIQRTKTSVSIIYPY